MYKYKISIKRVSGRLNESVLPSKNLALKSKNKKSSRQIFTEAADYLMKKYGIRLESAKIILERAPRINGKWAYEADAAEAAQKNHFIKRHQDPANWGKRGTLERLRDKITKELINSVYFRAGDDIHYLELPDGIAITLDGDVNVYGSTSSGMHTREDATGATWSDQSYDADEKAADNVFMHDFDDEDFNALKDFKRNLNDEISYTDYDEEEFESDDEIYETMRIHFDDSVESMKSNIDSIEKFKDIDAALKRITSSAEHDVLEELKRNVMYVIKDYIQINKAPVNSMMGIKKMEGKI